MKSYIAGLAAGLVALAPLPAHAAAPDPVKALQAEMAPGRGVTVSAVTRMTFDGRQANTYRTDRVVGFRKGGGVDTDDSTTFHRPPGTEALGTEFSFPTLLIRVKGTEYVSGGKLVGRLPLDKKWLRNRFSAPGPADLTVDLFQPGALKALLATASSTGPRSARGAIDIRKIPGRPLGVRTGTGGKLAWALWFDAEGRVTRLATGFSYRTNEHIRMGVRADLRFTGWGAKVTVEAPPRDLVMEAADLPELEAPGEGPMKLTEALPTGH
ncbi:MULTISPECIES: hypothetical protein [Nonomuraea]|uniref:DUF2092 domain-containing protein n=1 Tax=Nonomuraea mangrovi TaxID=2316207 RepID=A0ABW4ST48_9ACTN